MLVFAGGANVVENTTALTCLLWSKGKGMEDLTEDCSLRRKCERARNTARNTVVCGAVH